MKKEDKTKEQLVNELVTLHQRIAELEASEIKREQAEQALREERDKAQRYLDLAGTMFVAIDANQRVALINKKGCEILGYEVEEIIGKNWFDTFLPERVKGEVKTVFDKLMALEVEPVEFSENPILTRNGEEKVIAWHNTVLIDEAGNITGTLGSGEDITQRWQAEEKALQAEALKELDRLRSELLANVSHELRTPLASIKGFASTLLQPDVKWSKKEQQDFIQAIDQEADRLSRLISDLLDMSRLETGALKLERANYQISEIIDSVSGRLANLTKHHQLQVIVPLGLPSVFVDETRIGQVLTNLVENATKYSGRGSPITIEVQPSNDLIIISVTDRGVGIPPGLQDRVFDRFYQAESIATGRKGGTGLGLSICRGIIEALGGKIWIESEVGKGSKFSFSLPVSKREEKVA